MVQPTLLPRRRNWTTVISKEDFSNGAQGWSNNSTSDNAFYGKYLGDFDSQQRNQQIFKTFQVDQGKATKINLDFIRFDSWSNEFIKFHINDKLLFERGIDSYWNLKDTETSTVDGITLTFTPNDDYGKRGRNSYWNDQSFSVEIVSPIAGEESLKVGVSSNLDQRTGDESWGIDNFAIVQAEPANSGNVFTVNAKADLTVTPINDAPTINPELTALLDDGLEDTTYTIRQSDLLAGALTPMVTPSTINLKVTEGQGEIVNNNDGTWTFKPTLNFNGDVAFSYDITDGNGAAIATDQSFFLEPVNDAPVVSGVVDLGSMEEDGTFRITSEQLLSKASDVDGDELSVVDLKLSKGEGSVTRNPDGSWTFAPTKDWNGTRTSAME